MECEDRPVGYPGFRVARPPRPQAPGGHRRLARAKLSGITFFSAGFGGEQHVFTPWLTTLLEYRDRMAFVGVYRTCPDDEDLQAPLFCLRRSEWDRTVDVERVAHSFVFGNDRTHPGVEALVAGFGRSVSVTPAEPRAVPWEHVEVELADDDLYWRVDYSPLLAHSPEIESALPGWLDGIDELLTLPGIEPDGPITLSITRSVAELLTTSDQAL